MELNNQNISKDNITPSTSAIISDILIKYNLKETEDELVKKYFGSETEIKESNGQIIFWIAAKLKNNEKTYTDSLDIISEKLHISNQTAEQIMKDIKEILLPVMKSSSTQKNNTDISSPPKLEQITTKAKESAQKLDKKNTIKNKEKKLPTNIESIKKTFNVQKGNNIKRESDTYREQIE